MSNHPNKKTAYETEPWWEQGTCFATDDKRFFDPNPVKQQEALVLCASCPVRGQCLLADFYESLPFGLTHGIRGGYTEKERMALFTQWEPHFLTPMKRQRERGPDFEYN